jgi:hypothetical protein
MSFKKNLLFSSKYKKQKMTPPFKNAPSETFSLIGKWEGFDKG